MVNKPSSYYFQKIGYSSFCLDKRPPVFGAVRYRSQVENPHNQFCYLNLSQSDKLFHIFASRRTDKKDQIEFVIEKQVSGRVWSGLGIISERR